MKLSAVLATTSLLAAPGPAPRRMFKLDDYASIARHGNPMYAVTITNLTCGSSFTLILVASHRPGVELFTLGQAASDELAAMAEGGDTARWKLRRSTVVMVGTGHSQGLLSGASRSRLRFPPVTPTGSAWRQ
ncbi:MAG: spondin domain-containing protein [Candidatus Competibacteraceae bacterium]